MSLFRLGVVFLLVYLCGIDDEVTITHAIIEPETRIAVEQRDRRSGSIDIEQNGKQSCNHGMIGDT